jgi:hypothetical protein
MIDTNKDGTPDMAFGDLIAEVESILSNDNATGDDLERAKKLAESVNHHDKGNADCDTKTGTGAKGSKTGSKTGSGAR